jgi:hypothetical protein
MVVLPGREAADAREVLRRTRARANADTAPRLLRPTYRMRTLYDFDKRQDHKRFRAISDMKNAPVIATTGKTPPASIALGRA